MVRRLTGQRLGIFFGMVAMVALALPAAAQNMVQGTVVDMSGKPVDGAKVTIEQAGTNRRFDTKTDKKGEFIQIGLQSGDYQVTVEKDKLKAAQQTHVAGGKATAIKITLGAAEAGAP